MGSGKGGAGGGGGGGGGPTKQPVQPAQPAEEVLDPVDKKGYNLYDDPAMIDDVNPGGTLTGTGKMASDLPEKDRQAIEAYTGKIVPGGEKYTGLNAEKLNEYLRGADYPGEMVKRARNYTKELNANLSKVRSYKGETYRIVRDSGGGIAQKYTSGNIVRQPDFISASRSTMASSFPYARAKQGFTRFKIQSKTGKPIEGVSRFPGEMEVLYKSGTKFSVTSKTWNSARNTWDIELTEL